jgi:hypothetical protein
MTRQRSSLSRAHFTAWMVATLSVEGLPVGDNNTPAIPYGWQGEPNDSTSVYIPWMSVATGTARPTTRPSAFGDAGSEHVLSYAVQFAAVGREQVEWMADKMRKVLVNSDRTIVDCGVYGEWRIVQAQCISIGGITRVRSTFPDSFTQTDNFDIWVSREH